MKNKMLSAVSNSTLKQELERLFREYPFEQMSQQFSDENNCGGFCHLNGRIEILFSENKKWMLSTYCHEVAHAALQRAGHADGFRHGEDFVLIARALQTKFGVVGYGDHNYDCQDAGLRRTEHESEVRALRMDLSNYCPTRHAEELAGEERRRCSRNDWRAAAELR